MKTNKLIKNVEPKTWQKLKVYALKNGLTLADAIAKLLKES